jgi:hypothetical protein
LPVVPPGFRVEVFAKGFNQPRVMRTAPNGDLFVAETGNGRVLEFAADHRGRPSTTAAVFAEGLDRPCVVPLTLGRLLRPRHRRTDEQRVTVPRVLRGSPTLRWNRRTNCHRQGTLPPAGQVLTRARCVLVEHE